MLIDGHHLFPLTNIGYPGYYMDAAGAVWSTKRGPLVRLSGSKTIYGTTYTLNGLSIGAQQLVQRSRTHGSFYSETNGCEKPITVASLGAKLPADFRSHAPSLLAGIKNKGWIIGTVQPDGTMSFSKVPTVHTNETSLKNEMERLARSAPGTRFVSAQLTGSVVAGGVNWE